MMPYDDTFDDEGKMNEKLVNDEIIKEEVSKTIGIFDNMPVLSADTGFYRRFEQRIASGEGKKLGFVAKLAIGYRLAHILLLVIILANLATAFLLFRKTESVADRSYYIELLSRQCLPDETSPFSLTAGKE